MHNLHFVHLSFIIKGFNILSVPDFSCGFNSCLLIFITREEETYCFSPSILISYLDILFSLPSLMRNIIFNFNHPNFWKKFDQKLLYLFFSQGFSFFKKKRLVGKKCPFKDNFMQFFYRIKFLSMSIVWFNRYFRTFQWVEEWCSLWCFFLPIFM